MSETIRGSAGGQARALLQKEEAKQRIDEYNQNPNLCLFCNNPILAPYGKVLRETKIKKFCSHSCSAKYNNIGVNRNPKGGFNKVIDSITDNEIIEAFNNSKNITDFSKKLGYKSKVHYKNESLNYRLEKLGLSLDDLRKEEISISNETKGDLFKRYTQWQTARSAIQKGARKIYATSNKPKRCICCGYDKHFEVAHIKAVSDFDDDVLISEINNIDNLIALCPNHHWEYDNANLDITGYLNNITY